MYEKVLETPKKCYSHSTVAVIEKWDTLPKKELWLCELVFKLQNLDVRRTNANDLKDKHF